jgi:hypothetical protein
VSPSEFSEPPATAVREPEGSIASKLDPMLFGS